MIKTQLQVKNPDAVLFADWADVALIGLCSISDCAPVALYSKKKIYEELLRRGMSLDEVEEYYASTFTSLRAGNFTPVVLEDLKE